MKGALVPGAALPLEPYLAHVPAWVGRELEGLAAPLRGATIVHVSSTAVGGGVAEILARLVPLQRGLGLDAHWLVIDGDAPFFAMTKRLHNALQGDGDLITADEWAHHREVSRSNLDGWSDLLERADFVLVHDPQPAPIASLLLNRRGAWTWRCHIDLTHPQPAAWEPLRPYVEAYDASIFSMPGFARDLPHPELVIEPAIDPLTDKNLDLEPAVVEAVCARLGVPLDRPLFVQVSRFDRFKDPVGVIAAFRMLRRHRAARLVLVGGGATDDPEGQLVLQEVREAAAGDPEIHVLELPPDANIEINALQRAAPVVVQKSLREGFGLTVTEALWKGKPVIGGAVGGIALQVADGKTGYLVRTVEGCSYRMRECLRHPIVSAEMGRNGKELVRGQFLMTRALRDELALYRLFHDGSIPTAYGRRHARGQRRGNRGARAGV
jgi:trehalose synthase